jgi:hypothetical protein
MLKKNINKEIMIPINFKIIKARFIIWLYKLVFPKDNRVLKLESLFNDFITEMRKTEPSIEKVESIQNELKQLKTEPKKKTFAERLQEVKNKNTKQ